MRKPSKDKNSSLASQRFPLKFSLYFSSIILGSGMLTLPLAGATVGFIPLLFFIVLIGFFISAIYVRFANILAFNVSRMADSTAALVSGMARGVGISSTRFIESIDEVAQQAEAQKGAGQFDELIRASGMGKAAAFSLLMGMIWYVILASIGYLLIGAGSLSEIAYVILPDRLPSEFHLLSDRFPHWAICLLGIFIVVLSVKFPLFVPTRWVIFGALRSITLMLGMWIFGFTFLSLLHVEVDLQQEGTLSQILEMALFVASVVGTLLLPEPQEIQVGPDDMVTPHRVNVFLVISEIAILILSGIAALIFFLKYSLFITAPEWFIWSGVSVEVLGHWSNMVGLVIFAYVGTGLFNIVRYKQLFQGNSNDIPQIVPPIGGVLRVGTFLPLGIYIFWTLIISITLSSDTLLQLDTDRSYTTVGLAGKIRNVDESWALLVEIFGYFLALLAVTSACKGTAESLSDRLVLWYRHVKGRTRVISPQVAKIQQRSMALVVFIFASVLAVLISLGNVVAITPILSVAGNAGGGLLLLILPFFLPRPGANKCRVKDRVLGIGIAFLLAFLGSVTVLTSIDGHGPVNLVIRFVGLSISASVPMVAIWLTLEGLRARSVDDPAILRAIPMFSELNDSTLLALAGRFTREMVAPGHVICSIGEAGDKAYIVAEGSVEVLIPEEHGGIRRVAVLDSGSFFGEIALLEEVPRTATVQTIEPTTLLTLARGQFFDLVETIPDLRMAFETMVMERRSSSS